jgi:DHA2 family multidrug resistance protein
MTGEAYLASRHKWIVGFTCLLGIFMEILDTSVANVALATIQGSFAAGTDEVTWVITTYLVANAIILPITGWLGNYFGRKRLYLACLALFTLTSFLCGAAQSLSFLILMRILQGLAGGAMVPLSQAITFEAFPKEEQGYASALYGIGAICGPVLGPLLGGWITDNWSWPWIFFINVPVGIIALFLAAAFVKDPPYLRRPEGRVDGWSFLFIAVGLGFLELFLSRGERNDWLASTMIQVFLLLALVGLALFIWRSFTARNPLVNLRLFRRPEFAGGMLLIFLSSVGMYGGFLCLPIFVQRLLGYTPTWAGVILAPSGLASMVAMVLAGILVGKVHVRVLVGLGLAGMAWGAWMLAGLNLDVGVAHLALAVAVFGFGMGLLLVPLASESMRRVPNAWMGTASGLFNLLRNEGGSVGIAVCTTILAQRAQFHHARLAEQVTPFNGLLQHQAAALAQGLFPRAGQAPTAVAQLGAGLLGAEVTRQAYLMSFVDVFAFLAAVLALAIPFVLLMRQFPAESAALGEAAGRQA